MSLRLIAGRSGCGKTHLCLNEIALKQASGAGLRFVFIVPEQYSLQAERDLIALCHGGVIADAEVLSFGRLAHSIFAKSGGGGRILTDTAKLMVLRKIISEAKNELLYFGRSTKKQGFLDQLSTSISELFACGMDEAQITKLMDSAEEGTVLKNKLHDLLLIFKRYSEFIARDYITADDTLSILADKMDGCEFLTGAYIWMDGFYGFTEQEFKVIGKMLMAAKEVTITLTMEPSELFSKTMDYSKLFFEPWDTARKLYAMAEDLGIDREPPILLSENKRFLAPGISALELNYGKHGKDPSGQSGGIYLRYGNTKAAEAAAVAAEITFLVKHKGYRYRDIAVTTRDLPGYAKHMKRECAEYEIPMFLDMKRDIMSQPIVELLRSVIEIQVKGFTYQSVFRYLKTGLSLLTTEEVDTLENYVLKYGIKGKKWHDTRWQWGFEGDMDGEDAMNSLRLLAMEPIDELYHSIHPGKRYTVREIATVLCAILEGLKIGERLLKRSEDTVKMGLFDRASEEERCFSLISELFEKLVEILGDDKMKLVEFGKIFDAGLMGSPMGIIPPGLDSITVGDLERTRLPEIRVLFVVGANDGILPAAKSGGTGLFSDAERSVIEGMGSELAHFGNRAAFEEQYLIYCGITKPKELLYISYFKSDDKGSEKRPSMIISRIEELFPQLNVENFMDTVDILTRPIPTLHSLGVHIREAEKGGGMGEAFISACNVLLRSPKFGKRTQLILSGVGKKNTEKKLSKESTQRLFGEVMSTSVSRLERFSACPFAYFAEYDLRIKERKLYKIDAPDLGSFFHSVLELFSRTIQSTGKSFRDITEDEAMEIVDSSVEALAPTVGSAVLLSTSGKRYLIQRLGRISKRAIKTLIFHIKQGSFEPLGFEVGFGTGDDLPPIVLEISGDRKILLRGKIDRVDIYEHDGKRFIKIIDYKSGNKSVSLSDIYYGLQLQLLLYMSAFIEEGESIGGQGLMPGGVFYFRINDPMVKTSVGIPECDLFSILRKELKMSGLIYSDPDVLSALDTTLSKKEKCVSDIIPVALNKSGEPGSSDALVSPEEYFKLMAMARERATDIGEDIFSGTIDISPAKTKGNLPCEYCIYRAVCRFEPKNGIGVRKFKALKAKEVMDKILVKN